MSYIYELHAQSPVFCGVTQESPVVGKQLFSEGPALTRMLIGGGGGVYSYIHVLHDEFLFKSTVQIDQFEKNRT